MGNGKHLIFLDLYITTGLNDCRFIIPCFLEFLSWIWIGHVHRIPSFHKTARHSSETIHRAGEFDVALDVAISQCPSIIAFHYRDLGKER